MLWLMKSPYGDLLCCLLWPLAKPFSVFKRVAYAHCPLSFEDISAWNQHFCLCSPLVQCLPLPGRFCEWLPLLTLNSQSPWKAIHVALCILPCWRRFVSWSLLLGWRVLMRVSQKGKRRGWGLSLVEEYFPSITRTLGSILSTENKEKTGKGM